MNELAVIVDIFVSLWKPGEISAAQRAILFAAHSKKSSL